MCIHFGKVEKLSIFKQRRQYVSKQCLIFECAVQVLSLYNPTMYTAAKLINKVIAVGKTAPDRSWGTSHIKSLDSGMPKMQFDSPIGMKLLNARMCTLKIHIWYILCTVGV